MRFLRSSCALLSSALLAALVGLADPAAAAVLRQPYLQQGTPTSMTVVWRTDTASASRVRYGTVQGSLTSQVVDLDPVTDHIVTLPGLAPDTQYFYDVGTDTTPEAGGSAQHFFVTSPVPGAAKAFSAWIIGDSGDGSQDQQDVLDTLLADRAGQPVDLFLHMGDIAYNIGSDTEFTNNHFAVYEDISRQTVTWPTLGNHDADSADSATQTGPYYNSFVLPTSGQAGGLASGTESYYSFDYANVHFVVLDSAEGDLSPGSAMLDWMTMDVMATTQPWVVAYWHHPAYSKGTHDSDSAGDSGGRLVDMRENFLPTLESLGVDLVLAGHSHIYERSYLINGVYGYGSAPNFATPAFSTLQSNGNILDAGDGDPSGDGAYVKLPGRNANDGTVYVTSGVGGRSVGGSGLHPTMYVAEIEFGSCLLEVDGDSLTLRYLPEPGGASDTFTIVKGSLTEPFESFTAGQTVGSNADWFDDGAGPVVTAGVGVDGSQGLAPGSAVFNWTARPFDWNAAGFSGIHLALDLQTDNAGLLDDDRVGWTLVDNSSDSANVFGVQVDPPTVGGGLNIEGYWDGPTTADIRPSIATLPALAANTWYRLEVVIKRVGDTAASLDAAFTQLDSSGAKLGLPLATGSIADTSALGADAPDPKYFTAPTLWPAFKNHTGVTGAADNAYSQVLPGSGGGAAGVQPGDLIIAGFQSWNNPGTQNPGEFIELFNTTDAPISLQNLQIISRTDNDANGTLDVDWSLSDAAPNLTNAVIQPHSFFLIAESGVAAPSSLHDLEVPMDLATGEGGFAERAIGIELRLGTTHLDHVLYGRHDGSDTGANPDGDLDPFSFPRDEVIRNTRGLASFQEGLVRRETAADLYAGHDVFGLYTDDVPAGVWTSPHDETFDSYEARNSLSPPVLAPGVTVVNYLSEGEELVSPGPAGTTWRYYDQIPFGTATYPIDGQSDAWNEDDFDDSGWATGKALFGYGDLDGQSANTVFDNGQGGGPCSVATPCRITYLLRTSFEITALPSSLIAEIQRDDGFILYLNGVEVARDNLTDPVDAAVNTDTTISGAGEGAFTAYVLDPNDLVLGTNTLAVEVHNRDETSSDLGFDMRLTAGSQEWTYYDQIPFGTATYPIDGQSDAWNENDFDDSGWATGSGLFGYGDLNGLSPDTLVDNGQGGGACSGGAPCRITYLFRTDFEVTEIPSTLTAQVLRDDGFILYLNGIEVARDNLTNPVDAATPTDTIVSAADESAFFSYALNPLGLSIGTNTLAVEVHNRDETSSDLGFQMRLAGLETGAPPPVVTLEVDFDGDPPGSNPAGWFDTGANNSLTEDDSLFSVVDLAGENTFSTASPLINIHSHLLGSGFENLSGYQLYGRMRIDSVNAGIGITYMSDYPNSDTYYRLRSAPGEVFELAPHGPDPGGLTGTVTNSLIPAPNTWYRYRILVQNTGSETIQRANVWEEGSPEPTGWQIDASDAQANRITNGTIGVWAMASGTKHWDDFFVTSNLQDPSCGNSIIDFGETCDDGGTLGGDCCSALCQLEASGSACEDGDACTDADTCNGSGVCLAGGPLLCDDGLLCNGNESCDSGTGCIAGTPPPTDDGVVCTDDSCVEGVGVVNTPNDGNCTNGQVCDGNETCDALLDCQAGTPPDPDDSVACTLDSCVEPGGVQNVPDDLLCDDLDACTADACDGVTGCSNTPIPGCGNVVPSTPPWAGILIALMLLAAAAITLADRRGVWGGNRA